jgi:LysM repeat protein
MVSKFNRLPDKLNDAISVIQQLSDRLYRALSKSNLDRYLSVNRHLDHRGQRTLSPDQHTTIPSPALLLDAVPRIRTRFWVVNSGRGRVATGRYHYHIITSHGRIIRVSDNLLDIIRLIDGTHSIRDICRALAARQRRPVHPAEIVYLIHTRLESVRLVHLPKIAARAPASNTLETAEKPPLDPRALLALPPNPDPRLARRTHRLTPDGQSPTDAWRGQPRSATLSPAGRALATIAASIFIFSAGAGLGLGLGHHGPWSTQGPALAKPAVVYTGRHLAGPTSTPDPYATSTYIWRAGDNLAAVARRFHMPPQIILNANSLASASNIPPGTALVIPSRYRPGLDPSRMQHPIYYIVQPGDTISSIAVTFNVTIYDIDSANNIVDYTLIYPGQGLLIP